MIKTDPTILSAKPMYVTFTLPILSAISPAPTINRPENSADKLTAILIVPISLLYDDCNGTTRFTSDCANNQNVITPKIIPNNKRLSPLNFCDVFIYHLLLHN